MRIRFDLYKSGGTCSSPAAGDKAWSSDGAAAARGHCNERGTEAPKPVTKRGPRRVRMREYSVRRNLGLLLNSLAGGRALNIYEGTLA